MRFFLFFGSFPKQCSTYTTRPLICPGVNGGLIFIANFKYKVPVLHVKDVARSLILGRGTDNFSSSRRVRPGGGVKFSSLYRRHTWNTLRRDIRVGIRRYFFKLKLLVLVLFLIEVNIRSHLLEGGVCEQNCFVLAPFYICPFSFIRREDRGTGFNERTYVGSVDLK